MRPSRRPRWSTPATAASVTLIVLGTPQMNPAQLFPGNVNVAYAAPITVAGGEADFHLGPGLGLGPAAARYHRCNGSTTAITAISGTPTAAGSYTFTMQATDALGRVASQTMTMVVMPQDTCLLLGRFTYLFVRLPRRRPGDRCRQHHGRRQRQHHRRARLQGRSPHHHRRDS